MEEFIVDNLKDFVNGLRTTAFSMLQTKNIETAEREIDNLSVDDRIRLNTLLPYNLAKEIVKSHITKEKNKISGKKRYIFSTAQYMVLLDELQLEMTSVIMEEKVSSGEMNVAFDDELDAFVFWEDEDEETETS